LTPVRKPKHSRVQTKARNIEPDDSLGLYRKADLIEVLSLLLTMGFLFLILRNPTAGEAVEGSSNAIYVPYLLAWFVLGFANMRTANWRRILKLQSQTGSPEYMRMLKAKIIIASVGVTLCLFGLFYVSGGPRWIGPILERHFPQASKRMISFLAQVPGWAVSGIVGNYAFKALEKARSRILNRRAL
jgi:hypothetical protein